MLNRRGIGLLEVVVAMGIMGALVMGFMRLSERMLESERRMMDFLEMTEYISKMRYILNDTVACNKTVEDSATEVGKPTILPEKVLRIVNRKGEGISAVNEKVGARAKLKSMRFQVEKTERPHDDNIPYFVDLFFEMSTSVKGYNKTMKITIPMLLRPRGEDWEVISCDSLNSGVAQELTNALMERVCVSMGVEYKKRTGTCDMNSFMAKVFPGNSDIKKILGPNFMDQVQKLMQSQ